jgi:hypothetical protein
MKGYRKGIGVVGAEASRRTDNKQDLVSDRSKLSSVDLILRMATFDQVVAEMALERLRETAPASVLDKKVSDLVTEDIRYFTGMQAFITSVGGNGFGHEVLSTIEPILTITKGVKVLPEAVDAAGNRVDAVVVYYDEVRIPLELSRTGKIGKCQQETARHRIKGEQEFFYFVTKGDTLSEKGARHLIDNNAQPVFTDGCKHNLAIPLDMMIQEIRGIILDAKAGRPNRLAT